MLVSGSVITLLNFGDPNDKSLHFPLATRGEERGLTSLEVSQGTFPGRHFSGEGTVEVAHYWEKMRRVGV